MCMSQFESSILNDTGLQDLKQEFLEINQIDAALYDKYEVKRGLRNKDGSGVLAGLTKISSVLGFHKVEGELLPIDGLLKYRGTEIQDLVAQLLPQKRFYFERICFFLFLGRLPSEDELSQFLRVFQESRVIPDAILDHVIRPIPSKNVMNKLQTAVSALYAFDANPDSLDPFENFLSSVRLIAKLPFIVAYSYLSAFGGRDVRYLAPPSELSQAEAFLYVLNQGKMPSQDEAEIVDLSLVLHAEHGGGNNSTFTTYVVSSSGSDLYSTLAAAVASLKGPLHGAANKKVMDMMSDIKAHLSDLASLEALEAYLEKIVLKKGHDRSGKLYGLGHAVYTKSDPRAVIIRGYAESIARKVGREDEFRLYEAIATEGPKVFQRVKGSDKVISPNVDFYSGFVYDCLGIPMDIFTPLFAMARAAGWCSHRVEEIVFGKRIIRPGYKFI